MPSASAGDCMLEASFQHKSMLLVKCSSDNIIITSAGAGYVAARGSS